MAEKRFALGRGLSALIPETEPTTTVTNNEVDIDQLIPNRQQPRMEVEAANLDELAQSIRVHGVIQPIVVRKTDGGFEIVAGERRWRAAQKAGLLRVPVVIRNVEDDKLLQLALIENIQRENLNPVDEAAAYRRLIDDLKLSQEEVAVAVGKDRSTIANALRLLRLPDDLKADLAAGLLSVGHARALLGLRDEKTQRQAAREVVARGLSVREVEVLIRKLNSAEEEPTSQTPPTQDVHVRAAEERLRFVLGTRVRIVKKKKAGRIEIDFTSENELQRLYEKLTN
jgi:ParB family chromosome partitioning protein